MPSPSVGRRPSAFGWLVRKEARELLGSRAWWIMLACIGPLVGMAFIDGVGSFAEVSAGAGAGCGIVCAPLIAVWGPTFGAYEIAAIFMLPFVAIRLMSGDKASGALKIELQRPLVPLARIAAKGIVLLAAWTASLVAVAIAAVLWAGYGGHTYLPEMIVAALGHIVNAALTIALALAVAAVTDHPSTAAIVTLAITIGTWIVDFAAAIHGGIWARLAEYTPTALIAMFQHGLMDVSVILAGAVLTLAGAGIAATWMQIGTPVRRRVRQSVTIGAAAALALAGAVRVPGSWDASESRYNSFAEPEEEALEALTTPLDIEVHLAPQDPRRDALERGALAKLRRVVPHLSVRYVARTGTGLYEQADPGYGRIFYRLDGRTADSLMVTDEGVVETIFSLLPSPPAEEHEVPYAGYPLSTRAAGAAPIFYGVWPAAVAATSVLVRRMP